MRVRPGRYSTHGELGWLRAALRAGSSPRSSPMACSAQGFLFGLWTRSTTSGRPGCGRASVLVRRGGRHWSVVLRLVEVDVNIAAGNQSDTGHEASVRLRLEAAPAQEERVATATLHWSDSGEEAGGRRPQRWRGRVGRRRRRVQQANAGKIRRCAPVE